MSTPLEEIARNDPRLLEPLENFAAYQINCVQTVILPFMKTESPELVAPIMSMTKYLGGGVAGSGTLCGALLGAIVVLSRHLDEAGYTPDEGEQFIREFSRDFAQPYGTVFCSGINAMNTTKDNQACQHLVINTIDAVDRALLSIKKKPRGIPDEV
jgi:C_GCAxxG_C_C family probable redox protein